MAEPIALKIASFYEDMATKINKYYFTLNLKNVVRTWFLVANIGILGYDFAVRPLRENHKPNTPQENAYATAGFVLEISLETAILSLFLGFGSGPVVVAKMVATNFFGYHIGRVANKYEKRKEERFI